MSENSAEYRTLLTCTTKLKTAVESDLLSLIGDLQASGLIAEDSASALRDKTCSKAACSAELVELIQKKVKLDPGNYDCFIDILQRKQSFHRDILRILKETYSQASNQQVNCENSFFLFS